MASLLPAPPPQIQDKAVLDYLEQLRTLLEKYLAAAGVTNQ